MSSPGSRTGRTPNKQQFDAQQQALEQAIMALDASIAVMGHCVISVHPDRPDAAYEEAQRRLGGCVAMQLDEMSDGHHNIMGCQR